MSGSYQALITLLVLCLPVSAVALLWARAEYRKRRQLTWLGLFLLCAMLFMPNLVLDYATRYEWPSTPLDYLGVVIGLAGIALMLLGIVAFRSLPKVFCFDAGTLTTSGLYRWSRNPQYVGFFLFLLGFALNDWSLWCLAALAVQASNLHLLILVEEEHLRRVFGDGYSAFVRATPRYWGWGAREVSSG